MTEAECKAILETVARVKMDVGALKRAFVDVGGVLDRDEDHCQCPFCGKKAFAIRIGKTSGKPQWQCHHGDCGQEKPASIVDLIAKAQRVESFEACKIVAQKYGQGAPASSQAAPAAATPKKKGKLHMSPDSACDAALFFIRKKHPDAVFTKRWNKYTNDKGEPVIGVARFDWPGDKDIRPIHRDGNGWRIGLGDWGTPQKLIPMYDHVKLRKAVKNHGQEEIQKSEN